MCWRGCHSDRSSRRPYPRCRNLFSVQNRWVWRRLGVVRGQSMPVESDVVVVAPVRTAIGRYQGSFKSTPASDLGATAIRASLDRSGVEAGDVDEVIMGCVGEVGEDAFNARLCALKAGLPVKSLAYN